jgi:hypothetical protein
LGDINTLKSTIHFHGAIADWARLALFQAQNLRISLLISAKQGKKGRDWFATDCVAHQAVLSDPQGFGRPRYCRQEWRSSAAFLLIRQRKRSQRLNQERQCQAASGLPSQAEKF